MHASRARSL